MSSLDKYHADYPDRCIGFSEYGADANPLSTRAATRKRATIPRATSAFYHEHIAKMIADRPWLWATHMWNICLILPPMAAMRGGKHGETRRDLSPLTAS